MGNKLTCCLKPGASPRLRWHSGRVSREDESDVCAAGAGNSGAVPSAATAPGPAELDLRACEGRRVLHLCDLEMPEGKEASGVRCSPLTPGGSPHLTLLLAWGWLSRSWLFLASRPLILFPPCQPGPFPVHNPNAQFFLLFPTQPETLQSLALPVHGSV